MSSIIKSSYYLMKSKDFQIDSSIYYLIKIHKIIFLQSAVSVYIDNKDYILKVINNIKVWIKFILCKDNDWVNKKDLLFDLFDSSQIECIIEEYTQNRHFLFNIILQCMIFFECFKVIINNDTNIILIILKESINIDNKILISARNLDINAEKLRSQ